MELVFSLDNFLSFFPEFDSEGYAKSNVQAHGKRATMHIGRFVEGMPLPPDKREYALFLMTAHLLELDSQNGEYPATAIRQSLELHIKLRLAPCRLKAQSQTRLLRTIGTTGLIRQSTDANFWRSLTLPPHLAYI